MLQFLVLLWLHGRWALDNPIYAEKTPKVQKIVKKGDSLHRGMDTITSYVAKKGTPNLRGIPTTAPDYANAYIAHFET